MKSAINLPNRREGLPFSDAVQIGNTLYVSGRIGFKPGSLTVPEDPNEEVRYLMDGLREVVEHGVPEGVDPICPDIRTSS